MTIYAPALNLQVDKNTVAGHHISEAFGNKQLVIPHNTSIQNNDFNQRIADFVENARSEAERGDHRRLDTPRVIENDEMSATKRKSESAVIGAEKHKATVQAPTGNTNFQSMDELSSQINLPMNQTLSAMQTQNSQVVNLPMLAQQNMLLDQNRQQQELQQGFPNIGSRVSDDDFFHLTCFIDPTLIHKIEKGEFVELEKLLPKDKLNNNGGEDRLEWVQREGGTFLVPANRENKINGICHWEQAFQVYATIYCGANPHRAKEIWQYIAVINTAAAAYNWENVYHYDVTFRHLMAFNPHRSWAITYNQMWNLAMRDPLPKHRYGRNNNFGLATHQYVGGKSESSGQQSKRNKAEYCWSFNREEPCKFGKCCRYIERCSYCDSANHGIICCTKAKKKGVKFQKHRKSNSSHTSSANSSTTGSSKSEQNSN